MERPKIACFHIGTHKTGTTTLQTFFAVNRPWFNEAGIYAPLAGRHKVANGSLTPGHHAIAWDFIASENSRHFEDALDEVKRAAAPVVLLTSEEFHLLHDRPDRLRRIVEGFASIGYVTKILVYLRDQARYAESLYGEHTKSAFVGRFEDYLERIIADGAFSPPGHKAPIVYEYTRILRGFAEVVGIANVVARTYFASTDPEYLLRDFLKVIASFRGSLDLRGFGNPLPMENASSSFLELLHNIHRSAVRLNGAADPDAEAFVRERFPGLDMRFLTDRFRLIARDELLRVQARFLDDNRLLTSEFGLSVPLGSESEVPPIGSLIWSDVARQRDVLSHAIQQWGLPR